MKPTYFFFSVLFLFCQCSNPKGQKSNGVIHNEISANETNEVLLSSEDKSSSSVEQAMEKQSSHIAYIICKLKDVKGIRIECDTINEGVPSLDNIKIYKDNQLMFAAPMDYYNIEDIEQISYGNEIHYILLGKSGPISNQNLLVVQYNSISDKTITTELSRELMGDIDNDGYIELVGWDLIESVCDVGIECDSCYYNPIIAYQLDARCHLDTALTRELTIARYGCYLGTKQIYDTICICNRDVTCNGINIW